MKSEIERSDALRVLNSLQSLPPEGRTWVLRNALELNDEIMNKLISNQNSQLSIDTEDSDQSIQDLARARLLDDVNLSTLNTVLLGCVIHEDRTEETNFTSRQITEILKDIHGEVPLTTTAVLNSAIHKGYVLVVEKTGDTKQSQKVYQLTPPGRDKVQALLFLPSRQGQIASKEIFH